MRCDGMMVTRCTGLLPNTTDTNRNDMNIHIYVRLHSARLEFAVDSIL
jgi:hypothetical protein